MRYVIFLSLILSGCCIKQTDIVSGPSGHNGHSSLFGLVSNDPNCLEGGSLITMGLDTNDNGVLDINEVQYGADICNGVKGNTGASGTNGLDGQKGDKGDTGATGPQGPKGDTGNAGSNGQNGSMGPAGAPGTPADNSPFLPVASIQPCGANSSSYKEVLLGMTGGYIFAEFTGSSSTNDVRNAFIPDGNYQDTDSSHCSFSVVTSSNGNRVVAWSGGSAVYTNATQSWIVSY